LIDRELQLIFIVPGRIAAEYTCSKLNRKWIFSELGWKGILSDLVIFLVPGDHGTINTGNNLTILAQQLASWLD
jgi:hypothetical protein